MNSLIFFIIIFVVEMIMFFVWIICISRLEGTRQMVATSIFVVAILFVSALSLKVA